MQGSGFRVQGSGFRVQGSGCRVQGFSLGLMNQGFIRKDSKFSLQVNSLGFWIIV